MNRSETEQLGSGAVRSETEQLGSGAVRSGALSDCSGGVEVGPEWSVAEQFGKETASYCSDTKVLCSAPIRSYLYCGSGAVLRSAPLEQLCYCSTTKNIALALKKLK